MILGCAHAGRRDRPQHRAQAALRAGLPVTTGGVTVNRFCSSGLQAIAMAAQRVIVDRVPVMVAGGAGVDQPVQNEHMNLHRFREAWLEEHKPEIYMPMIETAEVVAKRYDVTRETQDEYALSSQQRTAAGQQAGRFDDEIVPLTTTKLVVRTRPRGETRERGGHAQAGRGQPARHHARRARGAQAGRAARRAASPPATPASSPTAPRPAWSWTRKLAEQRGLQPLGIFRGFAVAACEPDEMGIGPVFAVPRLLERTGLRWTTSICGS